MEAQFSLIYSKFLPDQLCQSLSIIVVLCRVFKVFQVELKSQDCLAIILNTALERRIFLLVMIIFRVINF
jgi:hypothetical protein